MLIHVPATASGTSRQPGIGPKAERPFGLFRCLPIVPAGGVEPPPARLVTPNEAGDQNGFQVGRSVSFR